MTACGRRLGGALLALAMAITACGENAGPVAIGSRTADDVEGVTDEQSTDASTEAPTEQSTEAPTGQSTEAPTGTDEAGEQTSDTTADDGSVVDYEAAVVEVYAHDQTSYTQGLEFIDGVLLESTGRIDRSTIRLVDPESGAPLNSKSIPSVFGEGATVVDDEIWQLTWQDGVLIIHDAVDLTEKRRVDYRGEGWGLCDAGDRLIMSDGSDELIFRDRQSFDRIGAVGVTLDGQSVDRLNELECVGDRVWANLYQSTSIVEIDPATGAITGQADLSGLVPPGFEDESDRVLNGIAYNADTGRFWMTGKLWPVMYELELRPTGP